MCLNPSVVPQKLYFLNESKEEIYFQIPEEGHSGEWNYVSPVYWSNDSKYVWIEVVFEVGELNACFLTIPSQGLYRMEFPSGNTTVTLPIDKNGYFFQFSPSGRYLGFVSGEHDLTLLDLRTGSSKKFTGSQFITGSMAFSPDEQFLAFSAQNQNPNLIDCNDSTIKILSRDSGKVETYFTDPLSAPIDILFWDNADIIRFRYSRNKYASLDVKNRKVTTIGQ